MCRILALTCTNCKLCPYEIKDLIKALVRASMRDPRLEFVSDGRRVSHDDGWGVAAAIRRGSGLGVLYERMGIPIFSKASKPLLLQVTKYLSGAEGAIALLHSRAASLGEPLGTEAAHPYSYEVVINEKRMTMFFAHNGAADKDRLCKELRIPKHRYSDSYALGLYIAKRLESSESLDPKNVAKLVLESLSTFCVKNGKKRGGVTVTMIVSDDDAFAVATSWFDEGNPKSTTYYQPYVASYGRIKFFASPTVIDALKRKVDAKPLESGKAVVIGFGKLEEV